MALSIHFREMDHPFISPRAFVTGAVSPGKKTNPVGSEPFISQS